MPSGKYSQGFTLVELLVALAIAAILVSLAAPSFTGLFERKRLQGAVEAVATHLELARSEAIKRNAQLTVEVGTGSAWCIGTTTGTTCDCTLRDLASAEACSLPVAGQNVLYVIDGSEWDDVALGNTSLGGNPGGRKTAFDPTRGMVLNPDNGALGNGDIDFSARGGEFKLRVEVNSLGRVRICSPGGTVAGYEAC